MKKDKLWMMGIILFIIMADQVTKFIVERTIGLREEIHIIPNFLYFTHTRNPGFTGGIVPPGGVTFLIIVTVIALGVFFYLAKDVNFKNLFFYSLGITLLIGGAIGNFLDRLFRYDQRVVDFIGTIFFGWRFYVFNIADMALTVGMIAFALDVFILEPRRKGGETDESHA